MEEIITVAEAEAEGISFDSVRVCRQIRNLAKLDRVEIDYSEHRSGINKHLFSYIEYCGMDVKKYITEYLSNLQPYMITRNQSQEQNKNFICVLDNLYRVSLYIKIDKTFGEEVVVSFHEDNKRGIAKENNIIQNRTNSRVPVFADQIVSHVSGTDRYGIKLLVQRGMLLLPIELMAEKCENGLYLVNERDIETPIIAECNQYLRDLYTSNLELEALDKVEIFSVLQQISFTSYGNDVFSNISLLIDNVAIQPGALHKKAADFALVTYVGNLKLDADQTEELKHLLQEKYQVSSQRQIGLVVERIGDILDAKNGTIL